MTEDELIEKAVKHTVFYTQEMIQSKDDHIADLNNQLRISRTNFRVMFRDIDELKKRHQSEIIRLSKELEAYEIHRIFALENYLKMIEGYEDLRSNQELKSEY